MRQMAILAAFLFVLSVSALAAADDKGHGSMPGMSGGKAMEGHGSMEGKMEGHGMMAMGDKVFEGKVGPWQGEARLMDMRAQMEKAKASGMKMEGMMKTHHVSVSLSDPKTKNAVTEGKGTVSVTGPDKKTEKTGFMVMEGHFGADVTLDKPGQYSFEVSVESGKQKGSTNFSYTLK
jgi:nitrogen fixation protein FixH